MTVTRFQLITLSKTHFLYVALVCLVILPVTLGVVFSPVIQGHWCRQFEIPEYERQFGFLLGTVAVPEPGGGTHEAVGITWVNATGAFARSGVRSGDIPRMHHGIASLCAELDLASTGSEAQLDVVNVTDVAKGRSARRQITITLSPS